MNTAFLLTGGNMGNRLHHLQQAADAINQKCGRVIQQSSVYQTAAWGFPGQPDFYNQALQVQTALAPDDLMESLLDIENMLGRVRREKMGPRSIDIDILLFNEINYTSGIVTIPHPYLPERRFALIPLAEIAGEVMHPVLNKSIRNLLSICKDELPVYKISGKK